MNDQEKQEIKLACGNITELTLHLQRSLEDRREIVLSELKQWNGESADIFRQKYFTLCDILQKKMAKLQSDVNGISDYTDQLQNGGKI